MKATFFSILTLLCFSTLSFDETCSLALQKYKEGHKGDVKEYCFNGIKENSNQMTTLSFLNGHKIMAFSQSLVFIEGDKRDFTAGPQTKFSEIDSLAFDSKSNEVLVFDSTEGKISFFPKGLKGNFAAFRTIEVSALRGATDIAVNEKHGEYLVLLNDESKVCFFDRDHNSMIDKKKSYKRCHEIPVGNYTSLATGEDTIVLTNENQHIVLNYNNPLSTLRTSANVTKAMRILWQNKDYYELSNLKELILNKIR